MSDKKIEEEELPRSRIAELGRRALIFVISLAVILVVWYFLFNQHEPNNLRDAADSSLCYE